MPTGSALQAPPGCPRGQLSNRSDSCGFRDQAVRIIALSGTDFFGKTGRRSGLIKADDVLGQVQVPAERAAVLASDSTWGHPYVLSRIPAR
jgi:hypothetical protein